MEQWPLVDVREPLVLQTCLAWFIVHCDMPSNTIIHHQLGGQDSDPHRERCVCRRDRDCITIFMDSGRVHSVPLPFLVRHMTPLSSGLLLERKTEGDSREAGLPTFFSLLNPMSDLCPVSFKPSKLSTCGYVADPHLHIVDSLQTTDMILLYHDVTCTHSITEVHPTTPEDIPINTPHNHHHHYTKSTTITPRSTSAPAQYVDLKTPSFGLIDTPVQMVFTQRACSNHLKITPHPISGGGGRMIGGSIKHGSGRSPFVTRLQTPRNVPTQKISKSVSPTLGRLSPFYQTIHSNSWSTLFSEESAFTLEPLLPEICLQKLFEVEQRCTDAASIFFGCDSLAGPTHNHIYYLVPSSSTLHVISTPLEADKVPPIVSIPALQTVPLPFLHVVLVLSPNRELLVYSGTIKVCSLGIEWLFRNGEFVDDKRYYEVREERTVVGIRAGESTTEFRVEISSGENLRCSLPQLTSNLAVQLSVMSIPVTFPGNTSHKLLASYYSSVINLSPIQSTIYHFHTWLISTLHLHHVSSVTWEQFINTSHQFNHLTSVPALGLFKVPQLNKQAMSQPTLDVSLEEYIMIDKKLKLFNNLHFIYEELSLYTSETSSLPQLASILHYLASSLGGLTGYLDYYEINHPTLLSLTPPDSPPPTLGGGEVVEVERMECGEGGERDAPTVPPCLMNHLHSMLRGEEVHPFPLLSVCKKTSIVIKLYGLYCAPANSYVSLSSLLDSTFTTSELEEWDKLLKKVSSPYERVVHAMVTEGFTRDDVTLLPVGVALPLWDAIFHCREHATPSSDLTTCTYYDIIGRNDVTHTLSATEKSTLIVESPTKDNGMIMGTEVLKLFFPRDLRINEVKRLLNSSQPVKIILEQKPEISDHEFIEQQEFSLLAICQRTMSLPIGRGMFTLGSSKPLSTSPLTLPQLELTGRAPPRNSTVGLDHIEKPQNMSVWAEFHNGVAAGLRIAPTVQPLDSTWILSNRSSIPPSSSSNPDNPNSHPRTSSQHAGVLLALGLTGHISSLMEYELFEYLHHKHEHTTIAVLLGLAAARVGSMQRSVASILSIFIPPLLPFGSADMEISQSIQTAGLVAMGLLYMASGNRHLTEIMLREIGHIPGPELEFAEDRESYALAAGIALGMITLGCGDDLAGMGDLRLVQRLSVFISGGPRHEILSSSTPQVPSHLILEPSAVNTHVTSPAATVALGLMYLKTNDSSVANRLNASNTLYELDSIRYDFYILRAASHGLIMWDSVQPTQTWINSNIPEIVQNNAFLTKEDKQESSTMDYQTLSQAMVCITAGCCMAIGLRYAGTSNQQAHTLLLKNIRFLLSKMETSSSAEEAGKSCLEMCLNVVVLSVAMVMSGSGDLEVLRIIRRLHVRVNQPEVTYGSHMATHMALGFLFLGGCRYSLSRSNQAIASLYTSIFPLFPSSSTDSRYHLQALRHLYVLATEPRVLVTRDVETGQTRSVEVCVRGEQQELRKRTPCIVPEWNSIKEIEICGPNFWPMKLNLEGEENRMREVLTKTGTVYVQSKSGAITSPDDQLQEPPPPSLTQRYYTTCNVKGKLDISDDRIGNLLRNCLYNPLLSPDNNTQDTMWQRFLAAALLECVTEEKLPILPTIIHLEQLSHHVLSTTALSPTTTQLWQLKLAWALTKHTSSSHSSFQLLHSDLADVMLLRVKQSLYQYSHELGEERTEEILRGYFMAGGEEEEEEKGERWRKMEMSEREMEWLAATIVIYGIPPRQTLDMTPKTTFPQLISKMQSLQAPPSAIVRLLPLMKSQLPQPFNLPFP